METLWIRLGGLTIGNTVVSATLVVAVYFVCAAIGNRLGGYALRRGAKAYLVYAAAELTTAITAVCGYALRDVLAGAIRSMGNGNSFTDALAPHFLYVTALVGLASICSGAAFAAVTELAIRRQDERTGTGGLLYAGNLVGAACGILIGGIALPIAIGNAGAFYFAAAVQVAIALVVMATRTRLDGDADGNRDEAVAPDQTASKLPQSFVYVLIAASGALSIAIEILVVAYIRQVYQDSVYTVSAALFAFIVNVGLGALISSGLRRVGVAAEKCLTVSLCLAGVFAVIWPWAFRMLRAGAADFEFDNLSDYVSTMIGLATFSSLPVLVPIGMVFPLAWDLAERGDIHNGNALGKMSAVNKICCAVGAAIVPFVMLPWIGLSGTIIAVGVVYVALGLVTVGLSRGMAPTLVTACAICVVCIYPALRVHGPPVFLDPGAKADAVYEGADGVVAVTVDSVGSHHIVVNQNYTLNGTERALISQRNESWLPLVLTANPKRVAFIGMASGVSADAALDFPIQRLDAIEINPMVVHAAREHFGPWSGRLFHDPRAHIIVNDGRYVIQSSNTQYDTVICTLMLPSQEGTSGLYSREFFASARRHMTSGGIFCLWLPTYQQSAALTGMVIKTFHEVFPDAILIRGNFAPDQPTIGLVGSNTTIDLSRSYLKARLASCTTLSGQSPFLRSVDNFRLTMVGDLQSDGGYFNGFSDTTDDHPRFAFEGPRPIDTGDYLLGLPLLKWIGTRFLQPDYPSCTLDPGDAAKVLAGLRAGNYYYAASVYGFSVSAEDEDEQAKRAEEADTALRTAQGLSPVSVIGPDDLER